MLDLINSSQYAFYNLKLARLLGIEAAVYISEIIKQIPQDKSSYFSVDRKAIEDNTTLSIDTQVSIENFIVSDKLIEVNIN